MSDRTSSRPKYWFRPLTIWIPAWRLALPMALLLGVGIWLGGRSFHGFLSVQAPANANVLVVEGWSPDYALSEAAAEFEAGDYDLLIASGGPMERGSLVTGFETYADLAAASLRKLGLRSRDVVVAPAEKRFRNRTFVSAVSVRELLDAKPLELRGVNVVTVGTHARRTWLVYQKALGKGVPVGVISLPSRDYDPKRWWASSDGVKATITEGLGWLYERLFDGGR